MHAHLLHYCWTLCNPIGCSMPGSSIHGILQAKILVWVACPPPGDLPDPETEPVSPVSSALQWILYYCVSECEWACVCVCVLVIQSRLILCDCSLLGSSVHGILQERIWNGLPFPSPWNLPHPGIEPGSPRQILYHWATGKTQGDTTTIEPVLWRPGAATIESTCHSYWSLRALVPELGHKRSYHNEKPAHCNWREAPAHWDERESPGSKEDPA